jgi:truncated hemoglobin YjbI
MLVQRFYDRVRVDEVLGPIFATRIKDWEPHLERMWAFWSSVALMTGRYLADALDRVAKCTKAVGVVGAVP